MNWVKVDDHWRPGKTRSMSKRRNNGERNYRRRHGLK
jgi:hypothetical protein